MDFLSLLAFLFLDYKNPVKRKFVSCQAVPPAPMV